MVTKWARRNPRSWTLLPPYLSPPLFPPKAEQKNQFFDWFLQVRQAKAHIFKLNQFALMEIWSIEYICVHMMLNIPLAGDVGI